MATKLGLYNAALREIGGTRISSLTEAREPRYVLDDVYDDTLRLCLEAGAWNFAMRSVQLESDTGIEPPFGYAYAFEKPDDWLRTCGLSAGEFLDPPLLRYLDENGYWWTDVDPIYVRYVSDHVDYGLDLSRWPQSFTRYVELVLARKIVPTLVNSAADLDRLDKALRRARADALSRDAMNDPPAFAPTGSWARARSGIGSWTRDPSKA